MFNRLFCSSSALRTASLFAITSLAAIPLALGGCIGEHQIADGTGGSPGATTGSTAPTGGDLPSTGTIKPSGSSTGTSISTSTTTGGSEATGPVEYSMAQIKEFMPQVQTQQWLAPGETFEPWTRIMVFIREGGQSCLSPISDFGTSKSHHELIVGLPLSSMKVGKYDFSSSDVIAFGDTLLTDGMGNGGGRKSPVQAGKIEILSYDTSSTTFKVRIEGLDQDLSLLNGDFIVEHCRTQ